MVPGTPNIINREVEEEVITIILEKLNISSSSQIKDKFWRKLKSHHIN
jgi:hypothetical protein